jgi:hypothetical protein
MMLGMVVTGNLSDAERRVWDAFPAGRLVEFGTGNAEDDNPAGGEGWGLDRQVRAEVLAALLCGAVEVKPGQVGAIHVARARIIGKLELPGATFKHRLRLNECYVGDGIDLSEATTRTLDLRGCHVGAIYLYSAKINGDFRLSGARLDGNEGHALTAERLTITESMLCDEGFQANGEVNLTSASIGGQLSFRGAHLDCGNGWLALNGRGLTVTDEMLCVEGFQANGVVNLTAASIGGQLGFRGARLDGEGRPALIAEHLTVAADMFCDEGFQADGVVNLTAASIGGQLTFSGAHLDGGDGPAALIAQNLTAADMFVTRASGPTGKSTSTAPASEASSTSPARAWTPATAGVP